MHISWSGADMRKAELPQVRRLQGGVALKAANIKVVGVANNVAYGRNNILQTLEVLDANEIERLRPGFGVRSSWTVGGMVTHFGHRHFRQNRYDARIAIVPASGTWKIQSIEILEQDRIK